MIIESYNEEKFIQLKKEYRIGNVFLCCGIIEN